MESKSLYIDTPSWIKVSVDDFIVAIGKTKSNSVYHISKIKKVVSKSERINRHYIEVVNSDLMTAIRRDPEQRIIPMTWYKRTKRKKKNGL